MSWDLGGSCLGTKFKFNLVAGEEDVAVNRRINLFIR